MLGSQIVPMSATPRVSHIPSFPQKFCVVEKVESIRTDMEQNIFLFLVPLS